MGVQIIWDDAEQTVLRYDIAGDWTWDDLKQGRQQVFQILDSAVNDRIYAIVHFVEGKISIPNGGMQHFKELIRYGHPKAGLTVIVGASWLMKSAAGTFKNAYTAFTGRRVNFEYADSLDAARQIIAADKRRLVR